MRSLVQHTVLELPSSLLFSSCYNRLSTVAGRCYVSPLKQRLIAVGVMWSVIINWN